MGLFHRIAPSGRQRSSAARFRGIEPSSAPQRGFCGKVLRPLVAGPSRSSSRSSDCTPTRRRFRICFATRSRSFEQRDRRPRSASSCPRFRGHDDAAGAEARQLLRHDRLIDAERPLQILHAGVGLRDEHLEQPNADRMRQRAEELRLERLQLRGRCGMASSCRWCVGCIASRDVARAAQRLGDVRDRCSRRRCADGNRRAR